MAYSSTLDIPFTNLHQIPYWCCSKSEIVRDYYDVSYSATYSLSECSSLKSVQRAFAKSIVLREKETFFLWKVHEAQFLCFVAWTIEVTIHILWQPNLLRSCLTTLFLLCIMNLWSKKQCNNHVKRPFLFFSFSAGIVSSRHRYWPASAPLFLRLLILTLLPDWSEQQASLVVSSDQRFEL